MRYVSIFTLVLVTISFAQPKMGDNGVIFRFDAPNAKAVYLAGEFNNWAPTKAPMKKSDDGIYTIEYPFKPGTYQYKFVIDGKDWKPDPNNPAKVDDNYGGLNSVITITKDGKVIMGEVRKDVKLSDDYFLDGKIYLNIIWHQHQPLYLDPIKDQLRGPWVRAHATKDYYDMAATIGKYPDIHCTINLTSVLLFQLQEYYVDRLKPYVDLKKNRVDAKRYFTEMAAKTDPWIDIALKPTENFTADDDAHLYKNAWNSFGISDVMLERFPEYRALKDKGSNFTVEEKRDIKFWHYLAWFDPDFLRGAVELPTGYTCDLSDLIQERDGKFYLRHKITEDDCNRMIAECYKVCAAVVPIHKKLLFEPETHKGQIEVITTPYYHPILPLIYDTDVAKTCMPGVPLPTRFHYPGDADAQIAKAVKFYTDIFGQKPYGMWPGEGSVSEDIVPIMTKNGIKWMATGDGVLYKSTPSNQPIYFPYRVDTNKQPGTRESKNAVAIVFRDTELSDKIGFKYQRKTGDEAADDFIRSVIKFASPNEDRLLTVILDGENAWEWYRLDLDGKDFLNALYRKLTKLQKEGKVITVTTSEYILGNSARGIAEHPVEKMTELEPLWPGSWINANFDTWIGEPEENLAWEYLLTTRRALDKSGLARPDPKFEPSSDAKKDKAYWTYRAWEEMYAAEGSDWFWWYGADQGAPGGDKPFDIAYLSHLKGVFKFMKKAGWNGEIPKFAPIIGDGSNAGGSGGTMAQGGKPIKVIFTCDASAEKVPDAIYIVGDKPEIGNWTPNKVKMHDDGKNGDAKAGDGIYTIELEFPENSTVQYKYTNSGKEGVWSPSEEFPSTNRQIFVRDDGSGKMVVKNTFGKL
ncbi:hypothetical protein J7L68_06655 [bacterium]|nr:hypothetical protein [bacterium]